MKKNVIRGLIVALLIINLSCMFVDQIFVQQNIPPKQTDLPDTFTPAPATDTPLPSPSDTPTITLTATSNYQATLDHRATNLPKTSTQQALMKTQDAKPMAELIESLYSNGYITIQQGTFTRLSDFSEQWAKLDWYQYWYQGDKKYANFVLSFTAKMQSASDKANWHHAGCGVVFRHVDNDNHMFLIIAQNGIMSLRKRIKDNVSIVRDSKKYSSQIPVEKVYVNMVVDGMNVVLLADGTPILETRDSHLGSTLSQGRLAFSVMSGTNKGYGTRCTMSDIWLWELE